MLFSIVTVCKFFQRALTELFELQLSSNFGMSPLLQPFQHNETNSPFSEALVSGSRHIIKRLTAICHDKDKEAHL